jgi:penicillin-binding protein 1A
VDYCRRVLEKKYGDRLFTSGLGIFTTLDYRLQHLAERAVKNGVASLKKRVHGDVQAALIAIDPHTGGIKAMVGGTNFWESQFNRVTQAKRQPGSAFKPIVYLAALEKGFKPEQMIEDRAITYMVDGDKWTPRNYNNFYYGETTMKKALAHSLNAATVILAKRVGIRSIIQTAKRIGIKSEIHSWYSSALGASELTLLELTYAYATLAYGKRVEPICTEKIIDRENIFITDKQKLQERVINGLQLTGIREMLRAVVLQGTGSAAQVLDREVYGKTGTTNDYADAWFIGFDADNVVGVWVGRDNRTPIGENETGATAALPIWIEFMKNT